MASASSISLAEKADDAGPTAMATPEVSGEPERQYLTGIKLAVMLGSLTLVTFLNLLDIAIVGTAIPRITTEFHSLEDVGWYVGAYQLASATLQPLSGKLYTHFRTKYIFLAFLFLFELGSLICALAPSSVVFIIGRAVAGLGVSGGINGALTIIAAGVPREKSPMYVGILIGVAQMGVVSGPLIGGAFTEHVSWRWCFYINLPVGGLAAAILSFLTFPEVTKKEPFTLKHLRKVLPQLDLVGFCLFVPPAVMFLLALQFGSGNTYAWDSATIIGLLCGSVVLAVIFILWERRLGDRAMLPGSLFKQRIVWTSCIYSMCNITCVTVASNFLPTYFQAVKGDGPTLSGVHTLPSIGGQLLMVVTSGALISRLGYYLPWGTGGASILAVGNGLISMFNPMTSVQKWVGYQIVVGAGRGAGLQVSLIAVQNAVLPTQVPVAMALMIFSQNFGAAIAIVISNTIFTQTLIKLVPRYAPSVSAEAALEAGSGAGAVRHLVKGHEEELMGVLNAYSEGFRNIFYFLVGISILAVGASLGMGWVDVRKKEVKKIETGDVASEQEKKSEEIGPIEV